MSDEPFLSRWARLKRQRQDGEPVAAPVVTDPAIPATHVDVSPPEVALAQGNQSMPARDDEDRELTPEELPPLETIDASTDLSPWLKKKLPPDWKLAALRRVWAADPGIANFIGPSDYAWDWNAPDGVPGFGPLRAADNMASLLEQAIGKIAPAPVKVADSAGAANETRPAPDAETAQPQHASAENSDLPEGGDATPPDAPALPTPVESGKSISDLASSPPHVRRGGGALPV